MTVLIGVSIVRNEADIIDLTVKHQLAQGVDLLLICDDDSSDGTRRALQRLALFDSRIRWVSNTLGGFYQAAAINALTHDACKLGADWILAFDADEFWYSPAGLANTLRRVSEQNAVCAVEVVNFAAFRDQVTFDPTAGIRAQYRVSVPIGTDAQAKELVCAGAISYIETHYSPKLIYPAKLGILIGAGAHSVGGEVAWQKVPNIRCLHVPLRAKDVLQRKIEQSERLDVAGFPEDHGWHLRHFARQAALGLIDEEWSANSVEAGFIEAKRGHVSLIHDPILCELVGPLVAR